MPSQVKELIVSHPQRVRASRNGNLQTDGVVLPAGCWAPPSMAWAMLSMGGEPSTEKLGRMGMLIAPGVCMSVSYQTTCTAQASLADFSQAAELVSGHRCGRGL